MTTTVRWDLDLMAMSSLVHGGITAATTQLFRRELLPQPDGTFDQIPVVSGNAVRSALRRTAGQLFTDALGLEGTLPIAAAAVLTNGGALAKTGKTPLSGAQRQLVRRWVVPLGLFGGAATGVLIDGCVRASKLLPVCQETAQVTGRGSSASVYDLVQVEDYTHTALPDADDPTAGQMRYSVEVLTAGTRLWGQIELDRGTPLQAALLRETITAWVEHGAIGGRVGTGHGRLRGTVTEHILRGESAPVDWRAELLAHRDEVATALGMLQ